MRVLLDEQLPVELATEFTGHEVQTVIGIGWQGLTNGELLGRARIQFEAFVTMDRNLEFQQNLSAAGRAVRPRAGSLHGRGRHSTGTLRAGYAP